MSTRIGFPQPFMSLLLFSIWQFLSNGISGGSIIVGLILAWLLPRLTRGFWTEEPVITKVWLMPIYLLRVVFDIIVASISVALLILDFRTPKSAFISYPLTLESPLAITVLASTISLTPGTVSADISDDKRVILLHILDTDDPEQVVAEIHQRYETPLLEMFR